MQYRVKYLMEAISLTYLRRSLRSFGLSMEVYAKDWEAQNEAQLRTRLFQKIREVNINVLLRIILKLRAIFLLLIKFLILIDFFLKTYAPYVTFKKK